MPELAMKICREHGMTTPLLQTKLYIPPIRRGLVPRLRLIERLNAGLQRKLTLISAPAGFGKTTLLSEWVQAIGTRQATQKPAAPPFSPPLTLPLRIAWVSLDKDDNDATRFLAYFITALQTIEPNLGEDVLMALQSPQPPPVESVLTALINEVTDIPGNIVLILDDYHLITAQPIHEAITFLLDHLPPQLHLAISTRADPPLPLAHLRGRGQLTELRVTDLRFTPTEAAAFLNDVMGLGLSAEDIAALDARTEGWVAGLQMAALSMQGREDVSAFIKTFSGSHRFVLDYLVEEVLDRQSNDIQGFLLRTSILERMSAPLCDAITGRADSQAILAQLEQNNLFLIPLDDERHWYRYHHLFADLLRKRLEATQSDILPVLHLHASEWYEKRGMMAEAVNHALAINDVERVSRLIAGNAFAMMDHGELATLVARLDALPKEMIKSQPWLCVARAWAFIYAGQMDALEALLLDTEESLRIVPTSDVSINEHVIGHIVSIRAYTIALEGDMPRAAALAREALERLPEQDWTARGWTTSLLANALRWSGDLAAADRAFAEASTISLMAGHNHVAVNVLSDWAGLQIMQGRLHKAAATCRHALVLADEYAVQSGRRLPITGYAHVSLSVVLRQWNDLQSALRHAREGIRQCDQWGWAEILIGGYINLAAALQATGDTNGALDAVQNAKQVASGVSPWFYARSAAQEARLWLAQGNVAAAYRWASQEENWLSMDDEPGFQYEFVYLTLARVRIAQGRLDEALRVLKRLLEAAEPARAMGHVVEILVLQAMALQAQGNLDQALTALERAISLAEPKGYVRTFVDEGAPMGELLNQAAARGISVEYVSKLLAALEKETKGKDLGLSLPKGQMTEPSSSSLVFDPSSSLVEPLSERELEVLRLLGTGLSISDIAQELFIAVSTLRSHSKSIYSKLSVHSRYEAVAQAKDLNLL